MKVTTLKNKLNKLNVNFTESNGDIVFKLNKKTYTADTNNGDQIISYFHIYGYDESNQEHDRRFFDSFNQVIRHSQR